ncbi:MAG: class F sortase [Chloroflexota bacterium]
MGKYRRRFGLRGLFPAILGLFLAALMVAGDQIPFLRLAPASTPPAVAVTSPEATATPTATPMAVPDPRPTAPAVAKATSSPSPIPTPRSYAAPSRLRIPRISVDAPVVNVGIKPDGELEAPNEPQQVGWYAKGYKPGEQGNVLIDGHVDWITGAAVFWDLDKLEKGDPIEVVTIDGKVVRFVVDWTKLYPAATAPIDKILGPTPNAALTLITCGGQFDRTSKSYTHRLVVRANLVPEG